MFQGSFKAVSREFHGYFKNVRNVDERVSSKLIGCSKGNSRVFQRSLKGANEVLKECF